MNLEEWVFDHYGAEHPQLGLERVRNYLPDLKGKIFTIAGTNGKGQVAQLLAHNAKNAGKKFVLWTSPHIYSIRERFRNEAGLIENQKLKELIEEFHQDVRDKKIPLSYYEFLFCVFCRWSFEQNPEWIIFEVGLGGRLDAVNAYNAQVGVVTSISRDHKAFLGDRLDGILQEKLGIYRPGQMLYTSLELKYLQKKLPPSAFDLFFHGVCKRNDTYEERNIKLVEMVCRDQRIGPFLENFQDYRKFEIETEGRTLVVNGAHNLDGVRKLVAGSNTFDYVMFAPSQRPRKEISHMICALTKIGPVTQVKWDHPRAEIGEVPWRDWIKNKKGRILVTGSYYFFKSLHEL